MQAYGRGRGRRGAPPSAAGRHNLHCVRASRPGCFFVEVLAPAEVLAGVVVVTAVGVTSATVRLECWPWRSLTSTVIRYCWPFAGLNFTLKLTVWSAAMIERGCPIAATA